MADKRMLIVDAEVVRKVDENRGDMSRSEFLNFLFDSLFREETKSQNHANYVSREEFYEFAQGMKDGLYSLGVMQIL